MATLQNNDQTKQIQALKGGTKNQKRAKSKAKAMGLKSAFVLNDKIAITSFAKGKRNAKSVANVESMTSIDGGKIFVNNPVLFKTFVAPQTITLQSKSGVAKDGAQSLSMTNPAVSFAGQDYVGIKSALEKRYFGRQFDEDNYHVQIAYNVSDIRKNMLTYINQIIYICYNLDRQKFESNDESNPQDAVGQMYFKNSLEKQIDFINNRVDADKRQKEQNKHDQVMNMLKNASVYNSYFGDVFKKPRIKDGEKQPSQYEVERAKKHNYNVLRIISMLRQSCNHEKIVGHNVPVERFLYNLEFELGRNGTDLVEMLDDICQDALDKVNKSFCANAQNNLFVLKQLYPQMDDGELVRSYYRHTIIKENANLGINLRLLREIFIMQYMQEVADKKYDTFRDKLYTVLGYAFAKVVAQHPELDNMIDELRANTSDENRANIYLNYAQKFWVDCKPFAQKTIALFEKEKQSGFKNKFKVDKKYIECFGINARDVSCFAKLALFVAKFLDKKETNELFASLEKKFNDINDLIQTVKMCGQSVDFKPEYKLFDKANKVAQELSLLKNVANTKRGKKGDDDQAYSVQMMLDAINLLGIDESVLNKEEIDQLNVNYKQELLDRLYSNKQNHQIRNFLINNVLKSRWFFYIIRYIKPANCRKLMQNKKIIKFVLNEIPDLQIARYYKSVSGYPLDEQKYGKGREFLANQLANFDLNKMMDQVEQMTKKDFASTNPKSAKEKNKALVGLYLTVAYLAVKNMVLVNSRYSIALGCLERDFALHGIENNDENTLLTQKFLTNDKPLAEQFAKQRDAIRDANTPKEQKRNDYKKLQDITKQMHFSLHQYYCISKNFAIAQKLKRGKISLLKSYRNYIAHLNVINNFVKYIDGMNKINSYFEVYMFTLQKSLIDEQMRYVNRFDDELSAYVKKCNSFISRHKTYMRDFLWVLNVPFAYNVARYKNLSIEDLFVGKNSKQKMIVFDENKNQQPSPQPTAPQQPSPQPKHDKPAQPNDEHAGKIVDIKNTVATARGGLRGTIDGTPANISPKKLKENHLFASNLAGKTIKVIIVKWDENAQAYNCEPTPPNKHR